MGWALVPSFGASTASSRPHNKRSKAKHLLWLAKTSTASQMKRTGKGEDASTVDVDVTRDGGIIKTIIREGEGETIPLGMNAKVHYTGKLLNGTVFDSSRHRGKPFSFTVGKREVILGWDKGVLTMK